MMAEQAEAVESGAETKGSCADCGRWMRQRARFIDAHTRSEVELCANCVPAFLDRQRFPVGCCG